MTLWIVEWTDYEEQHFLAVFDEEAKAQAEIDRLTLLVPKSRRHQLVLLRHPLNEPFPGKPHLWRALSDLYLRQRGTES